MSTLAAPPGAQLAAGAVLLERYRVVELVATGGHSLVYRGHDQRLERPVCIKVFTRYPGDAGISRTSYEHFIQEAFALSRLSHPHTLRIYDFGHLPAAAGDAEGGTLPFHVSEWMNGGTLAQRVREHGAQPWADAVRVTVALGEALAEAHTLGIVHRDLKPQNILFAQPGGTLPKLADFGIAKWHELAGAPHEGTPRAGDTQQVSGHRMAMYSPSWAAPEQLAGQPIDASSDVYSLALLTVFMLTGRAVFADDDVYEGYRKRRSSDAIVGLALEPLGVPAPAVALLQQGLAFEPAQRPRDAGAFVRELAAAKGGFDAEITRPPEAAPGADLAAPRAVPRPAADPAAAAPRAAHRHASRRVAWSAEPIPVAGRTARFVTTTDGVADVTGLGGAARLRLTVVPGPSGHHLHVKGLSCFVARAGARPSTGLAVDGDAMLDLVGADSAPVGKLRISLGAPAAGHTLFRFGDETVALDVDECPRAVLADFGVGAECAFVHAPGTHKHG